MEQDKLIAFYSARLEKVTKAFSSESSNFRKERDAEYVEFAKVELEKVKAGRTW